jgi:hypothetical protein
VTVGWVEIYGIIALKVFVVQGTAKQKTLYSTELLCEESEENDDLV